MDILHNQVKELNKQACKIYVCPNLSLIDEKGKELLLKDSTIKRAKDLAIEYFKKTYQEPHYTSSIHLLPAFVYIASILENDRKSQFDIEKVFGISSATIRKWYREISGELDIRIKIGAGIVLLTDQFMSHKEIQ